MIVLGWGEGESITFLIKGWNEKECWREREREILKKLCRVKAMLGKYEGPLKCGGRVIH